MIKTLPLVLLIALSVAVWAQPEPTTFVVQTTNDNRFVPSEITIDVYDTVLWVGLNRFNVRQVSSFDDKTNGPITSGSVGGVTFYQQYFSQQLLDTYSTTTFYFISENYPDTAQLKVNVLTADQIANNVTRSPTAQVIPQSASTGVVASTSVASLLIAAIIFMIQ
jgi:hypothetical protein